MAGQLVRHRGEPAASSCGRSRSGATGSRSTARRPRAARAASRPSPAATISMSRYACPWAHRTLIFRALKKLEGRHLRLGRPSFHGRGRLDLSCRGRRDGRYALRPRLPAPDLHQGRSRLFRPRDRAGSLGQEERDDRLQRILRDHPHAQFGLRRMGRRLARLLSGSAARRDRRGQRAGLSGDQQRRLSRRLRHHAAAYEEAFGELFAALDTLEDRFRASAISSATASPRPTGGCSPRWCASTRSMSATSSAICAASPTIRTCRTICATSTRCRASPATVNMHHIKAHYYGSHETINPTRIVPVGPELDYSAPHDRARFSEGSVSLPVGRCRLAARKSRQSAAASPAWYLPAARSSGKKPASAISRSGSFGAVSTELLDQIERRRGRAGWPAG